LSTPFQQLNEYVKSYDLDSLDQTDHGQVPFVVVLLKYIENWKKEDSSIQMSLTYQQRKELENKIREGKKTPDEENFDEAIANIWRLGSVENVSIDNIMPFFCTYQLFIFKIDF
jgi:amyloid beta precursor protein binding protein 1